MTTAELDAAMPAGRRVRRRGFRLGGGAWMMAAAFVVSLFALLPLGYILGDTIFMGWRTANALIFRPRVGELLVNTAALILLAVPITAMLSLALAWITERSDIPGAQVWSWLCVAPLAVPAFVQSYAWVSLIPGLEGLAAGVLVSVLAYFPFMYLPLAATLRRLDPGLEDAAAALGLSPARVFFRVVLPQLRLALCAGTLLVGLHLLAEYGLFAMIRFETFTTAIFDQFQATFNGPAGTMLAAVLVACCLALLAVEALARGNERYARVGSGAARQAEKVKLGVFSTPCVVFLAATALLALGVPLVTIGRWLLRGDAAIWNVAEIGRALLQTAGLAAVGGVVTVLAALPAAWLSARIPGRPSRLVEGCTYLVGALPSVVIALALVSTTVGIALPLYQTFVTILAAYVLMFLPRAVVGLRASIAQAPVELEHAAGSLGKRPALALWHTTIRLSAPGAAAAMALVSLGIMNELTATQMLAPNGTRTLAMAFWALSGELDYSAAAPYALIMIVLSFPFTWLLHRQSKRLAGR